MNCKPGDLAVVVRDELPENIGRLVHVIEYAGPWPYDPRPHWLVEAVGGPVHVFCHDERLRRTGETEFDQEAEFPDCDLKPLRDPGEDATDETLLWLPVPMKDSPPSEAKQPNKKEVA